MCDSVQNFVNTGILQDDILKQLRLYYYDLLIDEYNAVKYNIPSGSTLAY